MAAVLLALSLATAAGSFTELASDPDLRLCPPGSVPSVGGTCASVRVRDDSLLASGPMHIPSPAGIYGDDWRGNTFLVGLGLVGAGLVLGGAGFGILYYCGQGPGYCSDTVNTAGWILALPGILPLVVGALMVYVSAKSGGRASLNEKPAPQRWAITGSPLPGRGGAVKAAFAF